VIRDKIDIARMYSEWFFVWTHKQCVLFHKAAGNLSLQDGEDDKKTFGLKAVFGM